MALIMHPEFQLYERNDKIFCSSLQVAEKFHKEHRNVLADIRNLDCSEEFNALNFQQIRRTVDLGEGRSRKDPMFLLTRDGFIFLVMGYRGKKAAAIKEEYIKRFNLYEDYIKNYILARDEFAPFTQAIEDAQLEVTVPVIGGKLAGHPDCFISKGDVHNCLIDIKTMNDRAFTQWKREGSLKSKPQYVTQLHVYAMGCLTSRRKIDWLGIVAVNKNNSDWHIDLFKFNPITAAKIKSDAEYIFSLNEPPNVNCPAETWCCNYCDFHHLCQLHKSPEVHVTGMNYTAVTHDEDVINAMKSLQQARELSHQAREEQ